MIFIFCVIPLILQQTNHSIADYDFMIRLLLSPGNLIHFFIKK